MNSKRTELRNSERINYSLNIRYMVFLDKDDTSFSYQTAKTKNISERGLCLELPHLIESGKLLMVSMFIGCSNTALNAICEVVWCKKTEQNNEVGLRIKGINNHDAAYLKNCLVEIAAPMNK